MELIYSLLHSVILAVVSFLIALGSFFTTHTSVAINAPVATTTPTTIVATTTTDKVSTPAKPKVVTQKSGLPSVAKQDARTGDPRTFEAAPSVEYSTEQLNTIARASLVNVLCTTGSGGSFNPISGSGVIIDSRGIILTNAHVGQYFLLKDYPTTNNISCVIRVGSPAQTRYTAQLLYLPPAWINANASKIKQDSPTGTGENDYAFLLITGTTDPDGTLPSSFPALPMDGADPQVGAHMLLAAYPAGFLGGISITLNLYITSAVATVGEVYTFADQANTDLFSLGGTIVSQSGSSGGAVVSLQGKLQGLIATEIPGDTTSMRDLRAITIAHINRSLIAAGLGGIISLLSQDAASFSANFYKNTAPAETKALEDVLNH